MRKGNYVQLSFHSSAWDILRLLFPFSRSFEKKTVSCGFVLLETADMFRYLQTKDCPLHHIWIILNDLKVIWTSSGTRFDLKISESHGSCEGTDWQCLMVRQWHFWRWYNRDPGVDCDHVRFIPDCRLIGCYHRNVSETSWCLRPVAFAHIDVDIFPSAIEAPRSIWVACCIHLPSVLSYELRTSYLKFIIKWCILGVEKARIQEVSLW